MTENTTDRITPQTSKPTTGKSAVAMANCDGKKKKKGIKAITWNEDEMISFAHIAASALLDQTTWDRWCPRGFLEAWQRCVKITSCSITVSRMRLYTRRDMRYVRSNSSSVKTGVLGSSWPKKSRSKRFPDVAIPRSFLGRWLRLEPQCLPFFIARALRMAEQDDYNSMIVSSSLSDEAMSVDGS